MYGSILPLLPKFGPNPQFAVLRSGDWSGWFDNDCLADEVCRRSVSQGYVSDRDLGRMLVDPPEPRFVPLLMGGRQNLVFLTTPGLFTFTKPVRWSNLANYIDMFGSGDNGFGGAGGIAGGYVRGLNVILPASGTLLYYVASPGSGEFSSQATWFIDPTLWAAKSGKAGGLSFGSFINPGGVNGDGGGGGAGGPAGAGQAGSSVGGGSGGAGSGGAGGVGNSSGGSGIEFGTYGSGGGGSGSGDGGLYGGGGGGTGAGGQGLIVIFNGANVNSQVTIL